MAARHLSRVALVTTLLATVAIVSPARAQVRVSIQYDSEQRVDLAHRLVSELESEGYAVEITPEAGSSPCEANGAQRLVAGETRAWIRLSAAPAGGDTAVASICYLGSLPLLQHASASAPGSDPRQLAVVTAEALNGLRSRVSPAVGDSPAPAEQREPSPSTPAAQRGSAQLENSMALGAVLFGNAPDYPVAPGVAVRANVGLSSSFALVIDGLLPTSGAELASAQVTATVRTAWLRLGPRYGWALGDFELSGALLAGAAITWATAVAVPPRIGTADVSAGALFSLAAALEYPNRSPVFASASASASAVLPGLRLNLGDGTAPRGAWPLEAAIALGARWGGPL
jgi:hypothetical protein